MRTRLKNQQQTKEMITLSQNKFKYWEVNTTKIVRALNKADAVAVINRKGTQGAKVLLTSTSVDRIPAAEAHYLVDELTTV